MRQLRYMLILSLFLSGPSILLAAEETDKPSREKLQQELVAASGRLEAARRSAIDARLRLEELHLQRRLSSLPKVKPAPQRNSAWDRLAIELRLVEDRSRRLSDKLAPAHPEMQAVENELRTLRTQLENTPEFLSNPALDLADDLQIGQGLEEQVRDAEQELQFAESSLAQATEDHQLAMLALISAPTKADIPPESSTIATSNFRTVSIWCVVGGVCLAVLWAVGRTIRSSAPQHQASARIVRVDTPARRIVYPASNPSTHFAPNRVAATTRRNNPSQHKIVPRRRTIPARSAPQSVTA